MIFYFTGTGNSLSTARGISEGLQGKLVSMVHGMGEENSIDDGVVGIVTPVYCMDLPRIVKEFLKKYKFNSDSYIFAIVTCAGADGAALNNMKKILESRGLKMSYGNRVILPDNSIIFSTTEEKKQNLLASQETVLEDIVYDINSRIINSENFKRSLKNKIMSKSLNAGLNRIYKINNKSIDKEKCINCGICERICPVSNIKKVDGEYLIGNNCENCFACAHWCSQRSISIGKFLPDSKTQYTHPKVTLKDILYSNSKSKC